MKEDLNQYKSAYHSTFQFYDENQWYLQKYADYITEEVLEEGLKSVLSLGVGHKVVSQRFIELIKNGQIKEYHIVEGAAEIIDFFKTENSVEGVELFLSYFEDFAPEKEYDAIEMGFVLEHVDDPKRIIDRFKQFLKPDGVMFISVPNARSLHRMIGHYAGLLPDVYRLSEYDLELGHKRYFDLAKIQNMIEVCGLTVTRVQGLMLKPITGEQIRVLGWDENIISALFKIGEDLPDIANCIYLEARK